MYRGVRVDLSVVATLAVVAKRVASTCSLCSMLYIAAGETGAINLFEMLT